MSNPEEREYWREQSDIIKDRAEYYEIPFSDSLEEYKMARITNEQLYSEIRELRVVLLGVPETEDMGLYGEVRDMVKLQKKMNGTVKTDHAWVCALKWVTGLLFIGMLAIITGQIGVW